MIAKSFTDLIVWQKGHKFVLKIYNIVSTFPKEELYGLTSQIKRAAVSITANIAEGFVRRSKKEKVQFYYISLGSMTEIENHLLIARDLNLLNLNDFNKLSSDLIELSKLINGLIKSINNSSY